MIVSKKKNFFKIYLEIQTHLLIYFIYWIFYIPFKNLNLKNPTYFNQLFKVK